MFSWLTVKSEISRKSHLHASDCFINNQIELLLNVVDYTCANPSNPTFNEKCLNLLTDVSLQVFITYDSLLAEDSTFMIEVSNL